jgi:hypothetical protein
MIDALAAIVAVFLVIVVGGAVIPIVVHSRGLDRRVSALEEARRNAYLDQLEAAAVPAERRPREDAQAPALERQPAERAIGSNNTLPASPFAEPAIGRVTTDPAAACTHPLCSCEAPCAANPLSQQRRRAR